MTEVLIIEYNVYGCIDECMDDWWKLKKYILSYVYLPFIKIAQINVLNCTLRLT